MDNQVIVNDYRQMDKILKEERTYILNLCKKIKKTGCNVLLIQKSILRDAVTELSLHFLSKLKILCVKDVERDEIDFLTKSLGCKPISDIDSFTEDKDDYSLGLILTEIARWGVLQRILQDERVIDFAGKVSLTAIAKVRPHMLSELRGGNLDKVAFRLGDLYRDVVRAYLQRPDTIDDGTEEASSVLRAWRNGSISPRDDTKAQAPCLKHDEKHERHALAELSNN